MADLLAHTTEAARFLAANGSLPLRASDDLPQIFAALAVEGRALEALRLLALAAFLDSIDESRAAIRRAPGSFPLLEATSGGAASFKGETAATRDKIDPSGEVVDHASPELKAIRERLRKQRTRLRSTLESYLRGKETAKYLQDQVVTERNGRYVLVVKAEHRGAIPGIVHGTSTSGASLFLEPLSTVEINNDIVALEEQEGEEVRRILLALTDAFRARRDDMQQTIEAATELDVVQARARFSESIDGIEPALTSDGRFELLAARHPLLARAVPVTIKVIPPATVLLITGPNTGGKTVALKTAGLLALMAQAGLRIPAADGSRLPVFRSLFADIGDEQSIEASLSTFSAHIANIASMDQSPGHAGAGAARRGRIGHRSDRRRRARRRHRRSFPPARRHGHRDEPLRPAQDLRVDHRGRDERRVRLRCRHVRADLSAHLRLARPQPGARDRRASGPEPGRRRHARENLSAREAQLAEHLAKIDRDMRALEHEHRLAAREREEVEAAGARMRQREDALRQREDTFRRRLNEELDTQVRQARREIDDVIADLKAKTTTIAQEAGRHAVTTGDTGAVRGDARAAVDRVVTRLLEPRRAAREAGHEWARTEGRRSRDRRRLRPRGCRDEPSRRRRGGRRARQADARQRARSERRRRVRPGNPM